MNGQRIRAGGRTTGSASICLAIWAVAALTACTSGCDPSGPRRVTIQRLDDTTRSPTKRVAAKKAQPEVRSIKSRVLNSK
jgi:hypothetical protein